VYTSGGEVLLLQRADSTQAWQSVTGSMRWDEINPIDTARRELYEETGLVADAQLKDMGIRKRYPIRPLWKPRYHPDHDENREHLFFFKLPKRSEITINTNEHQDFCWLPYAQARDRVRFATNRDAIEMLMRNIA